MARGSRLPHVSVAMKSKLLFFVCGLYGLGLGPAVGQTVGHFNLTLDQTVTNGIPGPGAGDIESAGSTDVYTFTALPGQVVYFDEQSGDSCTTHLFWRCTDATKGVLFDEQLASTGVCLGSGHDPGLLTLTNGGDYTLTVYGQGTNTGTYQFTIWGVTNQFFNLALTDQSAA